MKDIIDSALSSSIYCHPLLLVTLPALPLFPSRVLEVHLQGAQKKVAQCYFR